ncbi:MAG: hypothetical protein H7067_15900, partial [Burkholderiales bacterium]|nr:hypothetical protein [Opitutaceae bacterium]
LLAALQAAAALAPLALVALGGERFFQLRDPLLWALHHDYIHEFQSLPSALAGEAGWLALPWLWLVVIPAGIALHRLRRSLPHALAPLAVLFVPACVALALTCAQIRWQGLATALCAGLAATLWAHRPTSRAFRIAFPIFLVCAVLQFPVFTFLQREPAEPDRTELASLVVRDVAWALHSATDPKHAVVLSGPTTSTQLAYFGGFRVLGTLYWENLAGLRAAAAIFGAPDSAEALRLCQHHGVTHLVLFSWDDFGAAYARLHRVATEGADATEPAPGSLARLLAENRLPAWLRPLAYDIPPTLGLSDERVQIYEIHPDQTPAEACLHLVHYLREVGDSTAAHATLTRGANLFTTDASRQAAAELARTLGDEALARRFLP